ncbi:MAG: hypothetical protein HY935_02775 [Nitrosomonadales bacterium]|nr:hypothetical protein [Nitrosomonadales bacterium]
MPRFANLFAGILFGSVGLAAFVYGKKSANWKPMAIGAVLMVYPYFIEATWLVYVIGVALSALIFIWRD